MSERSEHADQSASAIEAQAALWLERRHLGKWGSEMQSAFDAWMSESSAHMLAYWRLDATWSHAERLVALAPTPQKVEREKKIGSGFLRIAAMAGVFLAVVGAAFYFRNSPVDTYATALGEVKTITLSDGSKIELNTNSVLRLTAGRTRTAWLDGGEAYFQIKHDATNPFTVVAGGHRVTDLGTAFTVRTDKDRLEVSLLQGRARLETADASIQEHTAVLVPGDVLVATPTSLSVTQHSQHRLMEALGWRRGVLIFDHAALVEAADEFNRYNRTKLIVADAAAARRTIGATFPVHDVELFAHVAQQVLGLRVEHRDGDIVISR
jgi:transmembrane sensor